MTDARELMRARIRHILFRDEYRVTEGQMQMIEKIAIAVSKWKGPSPVSRDEVQVLWDILVDNGLRDKRPGG